MIDGQGELCSIPSDFHMEAMFQWVRFLTGTGRVATARVKEVQTSGKVKLGAMQMEATPENPVLVCKNVRSGYEFLRHLNSVEVC
jgi:hypothetical protein